MSSAESEMRTRSFDEDDEENHRQYAMLLASSSVLPMVLKAAIELGVLEIIGKASPGAVLAPSQIASHLHLQSDTSEALLDRMLRLLASYSILTCSPAVTTDHNLSPPSMRYGLAPVAKYFIKNQEEEASFAPMLATIQDKVIVNMWYHLKDAVVEGGIPFNRAYGMNSLDYVQKDGRCGELFKAFMGDYNTKFMKRILETYRGFEGLNSLVDVGGGNASILNMIVSNYPSIKGINFDLPPVIEKSPAYPGIENIAGDMFLSIPKGDAIFMKWILHTWDDDYCLKILRNCYESLPDNGKVIVVELVVPETPETSVAVRSDLQLNLFLMNMNPGGKERTKTEFESLAKDAGFSGVRVADRAYSFSLLEFYK